MQQVNGRTISYNFAQMKHLRIAQSMFMRKNKIFYAEKSFQHKEIYIYIYISV